MDFSSISGSFLFTHTIKRAIKAICVNVFYCSWKSWWVDLILWCDYRNNINTDNIVVVYEYVDMW